MNIKEYFDEYRSRLDKSVKVNSMLMRYKDFIWAVMDYENGEPSNEILKYIEKTRLWLEGEFEYSNQLMTEILKAKIEKNETNLEDKES